MAGNGSSVFVGAEKFGLYRRKAGEERWESLTRGLPEKPEVQALAVHPSEPGVVFAGTQDGPYRSADGGDTWERLGFPSPGLSVWSFLFYPSDPGRMLLGTAPAAVYRSEDGGDNWKATTMTPGPDMVDIGFDCRLTGLAVDPGETQDVFAAVEVGGVRRSSDGGESWESINRGLAPEEDTLDLHGVQVSSNQKGTVVISTRQGLFRSADRGDHWDFIDISHVSPIGYTRDLRLAPQDANTLYVSLGKAARSRNGGLVRSRDLGQTWERLDQGITANSTMMAVSVDRNAPERVYCATRDGQVFGTEDEGGSWRELPLPEEAKEVRALACG